VLGAVESLCAVCCCEAPCRPPRRVRSCAEDISAESASKTQQHAKEAAARPVELRTLTFSQERLHCFCVPVLRRKVERAPARVTLPCGAAHRRQA
jgi:hypothetical protein